MNIGPFYFDKKEIYLVLVILLIILAIIFNLPLWQFSKIDLLTFTIIILLVKGLLPSIHNEAFFLHSIVGIILLLFIPLFQVLLFYFISFFIFRIFKII